MNRTVLVALLGAVLVIGGCGREDAGSSADGNNVAEHPAKLKKLDFLIDWQAEPTYLGVYYARHIGAFEELGLDVNIIQSWGANAAASAISAGKYMVGTASGGATVIANSNGANLVSTAVIYHHLPTVIFGLARTGIEAPTDLKGKRIGIYTNSITRNEFDAFMKLNGLREGDVDIVGMSGPDLPLLLSGRVDAALNYFELSPTQLATKEPAFQLMLKDYGVDGYGLNIIASRDTYTGKKPLIDGITRAVLRGYEQGCADQDKAVAAFVGEFKEKDAEYVKSSWEKVCKFIGGDYGSQTVEGWQKTIDLYGKLGLLKHKVRPEDVMAGNNQGEIMK